MHSWILTFVQSGEELSAWNETVPRDECRSGFALLYDAVLDGSSAVPAVQKEWLISLEVEVGLALKLLRVHSECHVSETLLGNLGPQTTTTNRVARTTARAPQTSMAEPAVLDRECVGRFLTNVPRQSKIVALVWKLSRKRKVESRSQVLVHR